MRARLGLAQGRQSSALPPGAGPGRAGEAAGAGPGAGEAWLSWTRGHSAKAWPSVWLHGPAPASEATAEPTPTPGLGSRRRKQLQLDPEWGAGPGRASPGAGSPGGLRPLLLAGPAVRPRAGCVPVRQAGVWCSPSSPSCCHPTPARQILLPPPAPPAQVRDERPPPVGPARLVSCGRGRGRRGPTFLVGLVVQGDGPAAPLDGPVRLLLRAGVEGHALPLALDAAF